MLKLTVAATTLVMPDCLRIVSRLVTTSDVMMVLTLTVVVVVVAPPSMTSASATAVETVGTPAVGVVVSLATSPSATAMTSASATAVGVEAVASLMVLPVVFFLRNTDRRSLLANGGVIRLRDAAAGFVVLSSYASRSWLRPVLIYR